MHKKGIAWRDIKPSNLICTGNCPTALQLTAIDFADAVRIPPGKASLVLSSNYQLLHVQTSADLLCCFALLYSRCASSARVDYADGFLYYDEALVAGTPQFMAPETLEVCCANIQGVFLHSAFSPVAEDWWSVGATLYEAATGQALIPLPEGFTAYSPDTLECMQQTLQHIEVRHLVCCNFPAGIQQATCVMMCCDAAQRNIMHRNVMWHHKM